MTTKEWVRKEFFEEELAWIDAIEELVEIGYSSKDAEAIVEKWYEEVCEEQNSSIGRRKP